jgi:mono/diheme cytochrome c family protein
MNHQSHPVLGTSQAKIHTRENHNMHRVMLSLFLCGVVSICPLLSHAQADSAAVNRGRYLVDHVAQCGDCHTPRVAGVPDKTRWLKGSMLGFQPMQPIPGWMPSAPDITRTSIVWKSWGDKAMVHFFMTGLRPDGKPAAPPMPAFSLTSQDARAVVAYLKSLP